LRLALASDAIGERDAALLSVTDDLDQRRMPASPACLPASQLQT
jgi:hypothetical protein